MHIITFQVACLWHFLVGSLWHSCESVGGGEQKEKFFLSFPSPYYFLFLCSISRPYLSHAIFALGKEITAPQARVNPFRFVCQIPYFWSCDVFWTIICNYLKKMHSCAFLQSNVVWSEMGQQRMRGKSLCFVIIIILSDSRHYNDHFICRSELSGRSPSPSSSPAAKEEWYVQVRNVVVKFTSVDNSTRMHKDDGVWLATSSVTFSSVSKKPYY